eukprot:236085-Rhodomonas_salina.1
MKSVSRETAREIRSKVTSYSRAWDHHNASRQHQIPLKITLQQKQICRKEQTHHHHKNAKRGRVWYPELASEAHELLLSGPDRLDS